MIVGFVVVVVVVVTVTLAAAAIVSGGSDGEGDEQTSPDSGLLERGAKRSNKSAR